MSRGNHGHAHLVASWTSGESAMGFLHARILIFFEDVEMDS